MKRFVILFALLLGVAFVAGARGKGGDFVKGNSLVNANLGLKYIVVPNFGVSYEYCVASGFFSSGRGSLGVGGYLGTTFGALYAVNTRVTLHNQFDNLDFYVGALNGVNFIRIPKTILTEEAAMVPYYGFDVFLGFRWAFTENWGMNLELAPIPAGTFTLPFWSVGGSFRF